MPTALTCCDKQDWDGALTQVLSNLPGWEIFHLCDSALSAESLKPFKKQIDLHYLIYCKTLEENTYKELEYILRHLPTTSIIYYNESLVTEQFLKLARLEINACVIGQHRDNLLRELLPEIWLKHWKRIPKSFYARKKSKLFNQGDDILRFIENHSLTLFNTKALSEQMNISAGYFRSEFNKIFGVNFRDFKHNLLSHYESILLNGKNYKPNTVSKLLGYHNLATYSRSFKSRHGDTWRTVNKKRNLLTKRQKKA